jgi:exodeoxyribonuclease V alpha subunit
MYVQFPKIQTLLKYPDELKGQEEKYEELIGVIPELLIIDEFSMIDSFMFKEILEWCQYFKCRLLILGDENQLPSIGPGCNLKNIIECSLFQQSKLLEIKRQTGVLMKNIKKMTTEEITRVDFIDDSMMLLDIENFINDFGNVSVSTIKSLIEKEKLDPSSSKFISYFQSEKFTFNITNLNNILQPIFNPSGEIIRSRSKFKEKFVFKVGDIIIRTENDYTTGDIRANGEQSIIKGYDDPNNMVFLENIEDKKVDVVCCKTLYEDFNLAYALTVHKSQGSQYDNIVIFIDKNQQIWDKTALYTAISRAKNKCIVVASDKDFSNIQHSTRNINEKISLFMKESDTYEFEED